MQYNNRLNPSNSVWLAGEDWESMQTYVDNLKELVAIKPQFMALIEKRRATEESRENAIYNSEEINGKWYDMYYGICTMTEISGYISWRLREAIFANFMLDTHGEKTANTMDDSYPIEGNAHDYSNTKCDHALWLNPHRWELVDFLIAELETILKGRP